MYYLSTYVCPSVCLPLSLYMRERKNPGALHTRTNTHPVPAVDGGARGQQRWDLAAVASLRRLPQRLVLVVLGHALHTRTSGLE